MNSMGSKKWCDHRLSDDHKGEKTSLTAAIYDSTCVFHRCKYWGYCQLRASFDLDLFHFIGKKDLYIFISEQLLSIQVISNISSFDNYFERNLFQQLGLHNTNLHLVDRSMRSDMAVLFS